MPACFVNGYMFAGVFGHTIMLRLPEAEREKLLRNGGEPFAPMGRTMREYVCPIGVAGRRPCEAAALDQKGAGLRRVTPAETG